MNLLWETLNLMSAHGREPADVRWVGSRNGTYAIDWQTFEEIAEVTDYDEGYGAEEIATDLVVVGDQWWLERVSYDGQEWWTYKTIPVLQVGSLPFDRVYEEGGSSSTIREIVRRERCRKSEGDYS